MAIEALTVERRTNPIGIDIPSRVLPGAALASTRTHARSHLSSRSWIRTTRMPHGRRQHGGLADSKIAIQHMRPTADRRSFLATTTHWRVRTWNADGSESRWSTAGVFDAGLLSAADWPAL